MFFELFSKIIILYKYFMSEWSLSARILWRALELYVIIILLNYFYSFINIFLFHNYKQSTVKMRPVELNVFSSLVF